MGVRSRIETLESKLNESQALVCGGVRVEMARSEGEHRVLRDLKSIVDAHKLQVV